MSDIKVNPNQVSCLTHWESAFGNFFSDHGTATANVVVWDSTMGPVTVYSETHADGTQAIDATARCKGVVGSARLMGTFLQVNPQSAIMSTALSVSDEALPK